MTMMEPILKTLIASAASINFAIYAKTGCPLQLGGGIFGCFMFLWTVSIDIRRSK